MSDSGLPGVVIKKKAMSQQSKSKRRKKRECPAGIKQLGRMVGPGSMTQMLVTRLRGVCAKHGLFIL